MYCVRLPISGLERT